MTAWKDWERRACRSLGGQRNGPNPGSDCLGTPFAVELKRTKRMGLRAAWIDQARRQGRAERKPWVLGIAGHNDRSPVAVLDWAAFVQLVEESGRKAA